MPKRVFDPDGLELSETKLTRREEKFCYEFVRLDNATEAAINAGYANKGDTKHSCACYGSKLLKKPKIKRFIRNLLEAEIGPVKILAKQLLRETKMVALSNIEDVAEISERGNLNLIPTQQVGRNKLRAVQGYTQTDTEFGSSRSVKMYDKMKAIDTLVKILKMCEEPDDRGSNRAREIDEHERICELLRKHSSK